MRIGVLKHNISDLISQAQGKFGGPPPHPASRVSTRGLLTRKRPPQGPPSNPTILGLKCSLRRFVWKSVYGLRAGSHGARHGYDRLLQRAACDPRGLLIPLAGSGQLRRDRRAADLRRHRRGPVRWFPAFVAQGEQGWQAGGQGIPRQCPPVQGLCLCDQQGRNDLRRGWQTLGCLRSRSARTSWKSERRSWIWKVL